MIPLLTLFDCKANKSRVKVVNDESPMNLMGDSNASGSHTSWVGNMNKRKRVAELKHRRKSKKLEEKRKALKATK